jgi:hypothetical protein
MPITAWIPTAHHNRSAAGNPAEIIVSYYMECMCCVRACRDVFVVDSKKRGGERKRKGGWLIFIVLIANIGKS